MNGEYVTAVEADKVIALWAHRGTQVTLVEEIGDLAIFTQRRGQVELVRPGLPVHQSGETVTAIFPARFAEIVHLQADAYEGLLLRRGAGASGLEIALIADWTEDLGPDDILLMTQVARGIRPPM